MTPPLCAARGGPVFGRSRRRCGSKAYARWEQKVQARSHREGKAKGKAEAVLVVLAARGVEVTVAQRERVLACASARQLDAWLRAALTTPSVAALLSETAPPRRRPAARRTK